MNLYKHLPAYADEANKYINVIVDIPKGSHNKYEYDEETGVFKLDRVLHHSMFYPFDYGFVPQTTAADGDAVDVALMLTNPTFPGCMIKARVIGMIDTADESGHDPKIIAVPVDKVDPRRSDVDSVDDLGTHWQDELLIFFKEYKLLEKKKYEQIKIGGFKTQQEALAVIDESIDTFKKNHAK